MGPTAGLAEHEVLRGYVYPPGRMFLQTDNYAQYGVAWAAVCPMWIGEVTLAFDSMARDRAPKAQTWRELCLAITRQWMPESLRSAGDVAEHRAHTKPAKPAMQRRAQKAKAAAAEAFSTLSSFGDMPPSLTYNGAAIVHDGRVTISKDAVRLILWELWELNFRAEVLVVDRFKGSKKWEEDADNRHARVIRIFPGGTLLPSMLFLSHSESLGSVDPLSEVDTYHTQWMYFWDILADWPEAKGNEIFVKVDGSPHPRFSRAEVENACTLLYCQAFFDLFGRAPSTPRSLPQGPLLQCVSSIYTMPS